MKVIEALDDVLKGKISEELPCLISFSKDIKPMKYDSIKQMFSYITEISCLDYEIKIIEEDKEIEELKIEQDSPTNFYIKNEHGTKCGLTTHSRLIAEKLNEVIREVNKLKKESK